MLLSLVTAPETPYFIVFGLDPHQFAIEHYKIIEGQKPTGRREIMIGRAAARNLRKHVGDSFKLSDSLFRIVGIYETGTTFEDGGGVITLSEAQALFKKPRQVSYYQVKLTSPDKLATLQKRIETNYKGLTVSGSSDYAGQQETLQLYRAMAWFVGLLAILVGGLGMTNTMLMSVFERTHEIGVLRAVGWRRGSVLRMILGEALLLSASGGVSGIALGVGLIELARTSSATATFLSGTLSPVLFAQGLGVATVLGVVGGIYPAWRASRLSPVEAMRYEGGSSKVSGGGRVIGSATVRNLLRQRTRTLLTVTSISIGVGFVVALGAMTDGFIAQMNALARQGGVDLVLMEAKAADSSLSKIDTRVGRWVATWPEIESVSGVTWGVATVPGMQFFMVFGYDPREDAIQQFKIVEGKRIGGGKEIMLGRVAAKNAKKKVGDTVHLLGATYRIVGVYETGAVYSDGGGVISLQEAQALFKKPNQVSYYGLKLRDVSQAGAVKAKIEARFPEVAVARTSEFAERTQDMQSMKAIMGALMLVTIFIGGVVVMNSMLMAVFERKREIGTLRALGWKRRRVLAMILRESVVLSLLSGFTGIIFALGLNQLFIRTPMVGEWLGGIFSVGLFAQGLVLALVLGALGGLYPAWQAANLSPIEAIRYE
jgi:ABC-type antimicrobial peptide transport system permease subunit